jgi:hypothetical protein
MPFTPKELDAAIKAETAEIEEENRHKFPTAKETASTALQSALGELAEIQRLLELDHDAVDFATLEEIANLADNAAEECAKISAAVNKAFV